MMKEKIIILTPVYNDWKNLAKLLSKTNKIFKKQLKTKFELVIVNDCSEEKYNFQKLPVKRTTQQAHFDQNLLDKLKNNLGSLLPSAATLSDIG